MRLGIISDCVHYKMPDGRIATENHILLRQLQALCAYFPETLIACPFGEYSSLKVLSFYTIETIRFYPLPIVGGASIKAKLQLLSTIPTWFKAFKSIDESSDIVYQRFPNNLNIPGFFYFWIKGKKTFATYTGTWADFKNESITYWFQKWLLIHLFKGPVWVYSESKPDNNRILEGYSPSYSLEEWEEEAEQVKVRINNIQTVGIPVYRFISVGSLVPNKNHAAIIKACAVLKEKKIPFVLSIVGGGYLEDTLQDLINGLNLAQEVKLSGKKKAEELRVLFREHDFIVQAPKEEGYGKVPVEGFFHGLIPILNKISMAFLITGNEERGFLFNESDPNDLANTLLGLEDKIEKFPTMIESGRSYAKKHTLKAWAEEYHEQITKYYF